MTRKQWLADWRSVRTIAKDLADDATRIDLLLPSQLPAWKAWCYRQAANQPIKTPAQRLLVEW